MFISHTYFVLLDGMGFTFQMWMDSVCVWLSKWALLDYCEDTDSCSENISKNYPSLHTHTRACLGFLRYMCRTSYSCSITFHSAILPHLSTINMSLQPWDNTASSPQGLIGVWNHLSDGNQVKPCLKSSGNLLAFDRYKVQFTAYSLQNNLYI